MLNVMDNNSNDLDPNSRSKVKNVFLPKRRRSNLKLCTCIGHMMQKVLAIILCGLNPKVKGQIMHFLVNANPPKLLDIPTSNFAGA